MRRDVQLTFVYPAIRWAAQYDTHTFSSGFPISSYAFPRPACVAALFPVFPEFPGCERDSSPLAPPRGVVSNHFYVVHNTQTFDYENRLTQNGLATHNFDQHKWYSAGNQRSGFESVAFRSKLRRSHVLPQRDRFQNNIDWIPNEIRVVFTFYGAKSRFFVIIKP